MRVLYLWFEHLSTDLIARRDGAAPHVLTHMSKSTQRLAALSPYAKQQGLHIGQALADAKVLVKGLSSALYDAQATATGLRSLARFCHQFSPLVALDGDDALVLDIRGLSRLFGGEAALMTQVDEALIALGFTVRCALADTKGAAWALAHYGKNRGSIPPGGAAASLAAFPAEALRLSPKTAEALHRLGIKTIGALSRLPRDQLTRRYGREVMERLEQALGRHGEPLEPLRHYSPLSARLRFPHPLGLVDDLMLAAERLTGHLVERLTAEKLGLTRLIIAAEATDGLIKTTTLGFAEPTRDAHLILKLIEPKIDDFTSDFGFDSLRLAAGHTAPLPDTQEALLSTETQADAEALLLANLGNRLGFERLQRLLPQPTHLPDRENWPCSVFQKHAPPDTSIQRLSPRPNLKLPMPEPIEILEPAKSYGPPMRFRWRRQTRQTHAFTGPERITPPWWQRDREWANSHRDYWCVQTAEGPRLWLYATPNQGQARWFVAGDMG